MKDRGVGPIDNQPGAGGLPKSCVNYRDRKRLGTAHVCVNLYGQLERGFSFVFNVSVLLNSTPSYIDDHGKAFSSLITLFPWQVLLEWDHVPFVRREWVSIRSRFFVFVVESEVVWVTHRAIHRPPAARAFAVPRGGSWEKKEEERIFVPTPARAPTTALGSGSLWPCLVSHQLFRCVFASVKEGQSVCPSIGPSIRRSHK